MDRELLLLCLFGTVYEEVYDDPTLGYDQQEKFKLPEGFDPCAGSETPDGEVIEEGDWTIFLTKSEISIKYKVLSINPWRLGTEL